jgi:hypothetical protein
LKRCKQIWYCCWILKTEDEDFHHLNPALKHNILAFYYHESINVSENDAAEWKKLTEALGELKSTPSK